MAIVNKFGFLVVGVSDLNEATEFYSRFVRLDVTERVGNTAFMTGGLDHHWIRLEEGSGQGLKRVGYQLEDESGFATVRGHLDAMGIEYTEGGDPSVDRVLRWLRFCDPGGTEIELYLGMYERGVAPLHNGITMEKFLHGGWETKNFDATTRFYQRALGFKASDWIGDRVGFFRAGDRFHHSLVLLNSNRAAFNHFCVQVESLDDVMRFRNNALRYGVKLRDDLLRHAPSGSVGVYMHDEARGFAVEFCIGHPQVEDSHRPRVLPLAPETGDVWLTPLPDPLAGMAGVKPAAMPGGGAAPEALRAGSAADAGIEGNSADVLRPVTV